MSAVSDSDIERMIRGLTIMGGQILPDGQGYVVVSAIAMLQSLWDERAKLAQDAARYRWRTINSAPKDGTRLLLAKIIGHPEHPTAIWWVCSGAWSERWGNWNDGVEPSGLAGPTHWRPMPTPDEIEQPSEGKRGDAP